MTEAEEPPTDECPLCGARVEARAVDGHIRLAHAGEPAVEELLYWRQVRREARKAESAVSYLVGISETDSALNETTVNSCESVARKAGEKIRELVEHHPAGGS